MYSRNLVILANSLKYTGHCIAGKDLDTGEWIRVINNQPRPFSNYDLKKLCGDPEGPSLLSCVKISFQKKVPIYYQPENELITGDPWEKIGDFLYKKIGLLEDTHYPCWLGNTAYGPPDNIPSSMCNVALPISASLYFIKLNQLENNLTITYKPHENGNKPRLIFHLNNIRYDLGITDINYPRLGSGDDLKPKSIPDSFITLGIGQLFEAMNAHYKLVVGIIHSETEKQGNTEENTVNQFTNNGNIISTEKASGKVSTQEQNVLKKPIHEFNQTPTNLDKKLYFLLKDLRKSIADRAKVPPFYIFQEKSLREMVKSRPCDLQCFLKISGVGERKLEKYGLVFTSAIKKFCEENGIKITPPDIVQDFGAGNTLEQIYTLNQEISTLNNKLKEINYLKNSLLEQAIKNGIKIEGNYVLQSSSFTVRQLNLEAFKQLYPQVFMEIGTVTINDAEKILGKAEVTELCTLKESIKYSVMDIKSDNEIQGNTNE